MRRSRSIGRLTGGLKAYRNGNGLERRFRLKNGLRFGGRFWLAEVIEIMRDSTRNLAVLDAVVASARSDRREIVRLAA